MAVRSAIPRTNWASPALGGVEYFFNRRTTFKIEGRFMFVDDFGPSDPSGFAATFGIKRYSSLSVIREGPGRRGSL